MNKTVSTAAKRPTTPAKTSTPKPRKAPTPKTPEPASTWHEAIPYRPLAEYREVDCSAITPNPLNPRKSYEGQRFADLVASIKEKGVIEPIVVRPLNGDGAFELVCGERRWRASQAAGVSTIPALVRNYTNEQAFEVMTIENLQREDLTDFEEANCFMTYIEARGESGIPALAERIGLDPRYIRRRVRVMALPAPVLEAWSKGKILYGHCEQFLRLPDEETILEYHQRIQHQWGGGVEPVNELRGWIDGRAPELHAAPFPKDACKECHHNSALQEKLFGDLARERKHRCHNPGCFREKLEAWLTDHWKESTEGKKLGTNRAVISEGYNPHHERFWSGKAEEKCKTCDDFITTFSANGKLSEGLVCARPGCRRSAAGADSRMATEQRKMAENVDATRDAFFKKRLAQEIKALDRCDELLEKLVLLACIHTSDGRLGTIDSLEAAAKQRGIKISQTFRKPGLWSIIDALPNIDMTSGRDIRDLLKEFAGKVILSASFESEGRRAIGPALGIDLAAEFKITETYLKWKTIAQILAIGEELGIFAEEKVKEYAAAHFGAKNFKTLKKEQLIETILKSGIDLVGKVPKEILEIT
jgi:ParB family chromosome partitioning protein